MVAELAEGDAADADRAVVGHHAVIGRLCRIDADAYLHAHVTLYDGVIVEKPLRVSPRFSIAAWTGPGNHVPSTIQVRLFAADGLPYATHMRNEADAQHLRADVKAQIAADWDRGENLVESGQGNVAEGEKLIETATRDMRSGREQVELGRREVAEGNRLMQESEQRFRDSSPERESDREAYSLE